MVCTLAYIITIIMVMRAMRTFAMNMAQSAMGQRGRKKNEYEAIKIEIFLI